MNKASRVPFVALIFAFFANVFFYSGTLNAEEKESEKPVFIVTDTKGVKTRVRNLKIFIVEGSRSYFADSFIVSKGEAEIKVKLNELAGVENDWKNKDIKLYFRDGKVLECKIINKTDIHYLTGMAVIGDMEVPFKLQRKHILSSFREGFKPQDKGAAAKKNKSKEK